MKSAVVARRTMLLLLLAFPALAQESLTEAPGEETLGEVRFEIVGEPVAGALVDAVLTLTASEVLPEGTVITLRQHWSDEARLQHDSETSAAYVAFDNAVPAIKRYEKVSGLDGGLDSLVSAPAFQLQGVLQAGVDVRFPITDLGLPRTAGIKFAPIVYIQLPGAEASRIPGDTLTIQPAEFDRIEVVASSLVDPGQDIGLWVRMEDRFGNLVQDRPLSLDLRVNGTFRQRAELEQSVSSVPGVSFEVPGNYQVELRTGGGGIRAFSNVIRVGEHNHDILWTDFGSVTQASTGRLNHETLLANTAGKFDLVLPADLESYLSGSAGFSVDQIALFRLDEPHSVVRMINESGDMVDAAQPELVTDLRRSTIDSLKLAQIVAGLGHHLWLGHRVLDQGFPVSFVGSGYSRQYPGEHPDVYTAVFASADNWFEAMASGRTYVSVGDRIIVLPLTASLTLADTRNIEFEIVAASAIDRITLYKNGEVEDVRSGELAEDGTYLLSLFSDSRPFSPVMSRPRNAREWVGYIASRDATISIDETPGFRLNQQAPGRVDFLTKTHGLKRTLPVTLNNSTQDTVLEIGIAPGFEDAAWLPQDRLPQETPMQRFVIPLSGLNDSSSAAVRNMEIAGYSDQVTLEPGRAALSGGGLSGGGLSEDGSYLYRYQDVSAPKFGDYYHLVVELKNGAIAYSSTVFIDL